MTYYCILCDKSITNKSKYNQLKSIGHKLFDESDIRKNILQKPKITDIEEIMRKNIKI